jgi:hypothetical protein
MRFYFYFTTYNIIVCWCHILSFKTTVPIDSIELNSEKYTAIYVGIYSIYPNQITAQKCRTDRKNNIDHILGITQCLCSLSSTCVGLTLAQHLSLLISAGIFAYITGTNITICTKFHHFPPFPYEQYTVVFIHLTEIVMVHRVLD